MKALKKESPLVTPIKKDYQYIGNKLVNEISKPKEKFFQFLNEDIENTDLSDFEFRLLLKLYSMKNGTTVSNKALSRKFDKTLRTINDNLENLKQKKYIHINKDKELIIRRLSKNTIPIPIESVNDLKMSFLEKIS